MGANLHKSKENMHQTIVTGDPCVHMVEINFADLIAGPGCLESIQYVWLLPDVIGRSNRHQTSCLDYVTSPTYLSPCRRWTNLHVTVFFKKLNIGNKYAEIDNICDSDKTTMQRQNDLLMK